LAVMLVLGFIWLSLGFRGLREGIDDRVWAKRMFLFSLVVLLLFSITISIGSFY